MGERSIRRRLKGVLQCALEERGMMHGAAAFGTNRRYHQCWWARARLIIIDNVLAPFEMGLDLDSREEMSAW